MRIIKSLFIVFGLLSISAFATKAYFSDQVTIVAAPSEPEVAALS